ncbi:hypothetical protein PAHAL_7G211900 [Panicum hallii]|uniref:Uncharacterized protein n=1 Tax=Panicum hallii TaxID=206008 RepID=A0A2S3I8M9_9POAL|nr:hypothetical protein PAHAL_7G211900 [Panicum hallii]
MARRLDKSTARKPRFYLGEELKWAKVPQFLFNHRLLPTNTTFNDKDTPLTNRMVHQISCSLKNGTIYMK